MTHRDPLLDQHVGEQGATAVLLASHLGWAVIPFSRSTGFAANSLANKLKRTAIIYLEFSFISAQIEKLLEHHYFEEDQRINSPPTSTALTLLRTTFVEQ